MARPIEYKEEYTKKAKDYLESYETLGEVVPTIEGFADYLGISKKSIYNWTKQNESGVMIASDEFLHAISQIETKQGKVLQNKGLGGEFNPTITKLLLSANHGMRERTDITTDDKAFETDLTDEQLERIISKRQTGKTSDSEESS